MTYDENGELAPGNAESWESNDDMTVWTFHLRDGLKWSDGTPLTAKDYVYSALYVMTPTTTSPVCEHDDGLHRERPGVL